MRLEPLELWLKPAPGALLPQVRAALADSTRWRRAPALGDHGGGS